MSVLKLPWVTHTRRRGEKCQLVLTPLPVCKIGLDETVNIVFTPPSVITPERSGCFAPSPPNQMKETGSWQYSREQWVVAIHVASMDIKKWQQEQTDPCQDLGVTCDPWLGMCHWVSALLRSSTCFDLGLKANYLAMDNRNVVEVWKGTCHWSLLLVLRFWVIWRMSSESSRTSVKNHEASIWLLTSDWLKDEAQIKDWKIDKNHAV